MKKFYVLSFIMLLSVAAIAQRQNYKCVAMPDQNLGAKVLIDTLEPGTFFSASAYYIYTTAYVGPNGSGGFVVGTNGYEDVAKAQVFIVVGTYAIQGCMYWFGGKIQGTGAGTIDFNIYEMDGTGTSTMGSSVTAPGTVIATLTQNYTDVDTSTYLADAHVVTFTTPVFRTSDYAIGFNVSGCYASGDSIGLIASADGDAGQSELCWEQWSDNSWYTFLEDGSGWGLDFDLAILPIVDLEAIGVEGNQWANGLKMSTYPNPAANNVTLAYALQNDSKKVRIRITDAEGRTMEDLNLGSQTAGVYNIQMDVTNYANGTYYYVVNADKSRVAIKMIVNK